MSSILQCLHRHMLGTRWAAHHCPPLGSPPLPNLASSLASFRVRLCRTFSGPYDCLLTHPQRAQYCACTGSAGADCLKERIWYVVCHKLGVPKQPSGCCQFLRSKWLVLVLHKRFALHQTSAFRCSTHGNTKATMHRQPLLHLCAYSPPQGSKPSLHDALHTQRLCWHDTIMTPSVDTAILQQAKLTCHCMHPTSHVQTRAY